MYTPGGLELLIISFTEWPPLAPDAEMAMLIKTSVEVNLLRVHGERPSLQVSKIGVEEGDFDYRLQSQLSGRARALFSDCLIDPALAMGVS